MNGGVYYAPDAPFGGYKLICDAASGLPIAYHITPASVHDAAAVKELMDSLAIKHPEIKSKYWLYDSGYDSAWLYEEVIKNRNGHPIIAFNGRGSLAPPAGFDEKLHPVCSGGKTILGSSAIRFAVQKHGRRSTIRELQWNG